MLAGAAAALVLLRDHQGCMLQDALPCAVGQFAIGAVPHLSTVSAICKNGGA
jgi:hypothetical protein